MNLFSTSLWSGLATALRLASGLIVAKMIAVSGGAESLAAFGQFQNFLALIVVLSGGVFELGLVKYTAEFKKSDEKMFGLLAATIKSTTIIVLLVSGILMLFYHEIASAILHQSKWASLFLGVAIILPMLVGNRIALALLNGMGKIRHYLLLNASTSLFNMLAVIILSLWYGVDGALFGLLVGPLLTGIISIAFVFKMYGRLLLGAMHVSVSEMWYGRLGQFVFMALTALLSSVILPMFIRDELIGQIGWQEAGYWQAVWQISSAYLAVISAGFSVYYLPKLSQIDDSKLIRYEMLNFYRIAMPIVVVVGSLIWLFREYLLLLLYTKEFLPASQLFAWQIFGDILKVMSLVMSFMMLAKKMTLWFVGSEVMFFMLVCMGNHFLISKLGILSPVIVNAFVYGLYMFFMYCLIGHQYLWKCRRL